LTASKRLVDIVETIGGGGVNEAKNKGRKRVNEVEGKVSNWGSTTATSSLMTRTERLVSILPDICPYKRTEIFS
jgi:hypothetical protein